MRAEEQNGFSATQKQGCVPLPGFRPMVPISDGQAVRLHAAP